MISYLLELGTSWTSKPVMLWQGQEWISFMLVGSFMWGSFTIIWELIIIRIIEILTKAKNKRRVRKYENSNRKRKKNNVRKRVSVF